MREFISPHAPARAPKARGKPEGRPGQRGPDHEMGSARECSCKAKKPMAMTLALVRLELNMLPARVGVAVVVASTAWALSAPLPHDGVDASGLGDWTVWCASAVVTSLIFTRGWWARRAMPPASVSGD